MQSITFVDGHRVRRTTLPRNGSVRRDSNDVFVWEHVGLLLVDYRRGFELCVVIRADVAQFLFDVTNKPPSSVVAVKEYQIFIEYSARSRPAKQRMAWSRVQPS